MLVSSYAGYHGDNDADGNGAHAYPELLRRSHINAPSVVGLLKPSMEKFCHQNAQMPDFSRLRLPTAKMDVQANFPRTHPQR